MLLEITNIYETLVYIAAFALAGFVVWCINKYN